MIRHRLKEPFFAAILIALGVNIFLFALLPGLRTQSTRREDAIRSRVVSMVKLEKTESDTRQQKPQDPKKEEPLPQPKLELPIETTLAHTPDAPPLKANPNLPKLDTSAFRPHMGDMIFGTSDLDTQPTPTHKINPIYPFKAKRLGISGRVLVQFRVGKNGSVSHIKILESTPPGVFDKAVLDAVSRWKYNPGEITGEKVAATLIKPIVFNLGD